MTYLPGQHRKAALGFRGQPVLDDQASLREKSLLPLSSQCGVNNRVWFGALINYSKFLK